MLMYVRELECLKKLERQSTSLYAATLKEIDISIDLFNIKIGKV